MKFEARKPDLRWDLSTADGQRALLQYLYYLTEEIEKSVNNIDKDNISPDYVPGKE